MVTRLFIPFRNTVSLLLLCFALHGCRDCNRYSLRDIPCAKITPLESFTKEQNGLKIVLVGGCFDVLHVGHLLFLSEAKKRGDYLVVALEPDETIVSKKGRYPINSQLHRAEALSYVRGVDEVVLLPPLSGYDDYLAMTAKIRPSVIAVIDPDPGLNNKARIALSLGSSIATVGAVDERFSTSLMITRLAERDISEDLSVKGVVVSGKGIARKFGFPTLNIPLPANSPIRTGVHLCKAFVNGIDYNALCFRGSASPEFLEAHLLGKRLSEKVDFASVRLVEFLRPERRFDGFDDAVHQIGLDALLATHRFKTNSHDLAPVGK